LAISGQRDENLSCECSAQATLLFPHLPLRHEDADGKEWAAVQTRAGLSLLVRFTPQGPGIGRPRV
jgi:hypothetical protein